MTHFATRSHRRETGLTFEKNTFRCDPKQCLGVQINGLINALKCLYLQNMLTVCSVQYDCVACAVTRTTKPMRWGLVTFTFTEKWKECVVNLFVLRKITQPWLNPTFNLNCLMSQCVLHGAGRAWRLAWMYMDRANREGCWCCWTFSAKNLLEDDPSECHQPFGVGVLDLKRRGRASNEFGHLHV